MPGNYKLLDFITRVHDLILMEARSLTGADFSCRRKEIDFFTFPVG